LVLRLWKSRLRLFRSACCDLVRSSSTLNPASLKSLENFRKWCLCISELNTNRTGLGLVRSATNLPTRSAATRQVRNFSRSFPLYLSSAVSTAVSSSVFRVLSASNLFFARAKESSLSFFWYVVHNQIQTLLVSFDLFKLAIMRFACPLQFDQPLFALSPFAVCIIRCSLYSSATGAIVKQRSSSFELGG